MKLGVSIKTTEPILWTNMLLKINEPRTTLSIRIKVTILRAGKTSPLFTRGLYLGPDQKIMSKKSKIFPSIPHKFV